MSGLPVIKYWFAVLTIVSPPNFAISNYYEEYIIYAPILVKIGSASELFMQVFLAFISDCGKVL